MSKFLRVATVKGMFEKAGLPRASHEIIWGVSRAHRERSRGAGTLVRGFQLRTRPASKGSQRWHYHADDVRKVVAVVREAIAENRRTTQPHRFRAENWLPSQLAEQTYGFPKVTLIQWAASRHNSRECPWIGRKVVSKVWLARRDDGKLRWARFYREADLIAAKAARDSGTPASARPTAPPAKAVKHDKPDPDRWATSEEAMKITGAKSVPHLFRWHNVGFLAPRRRRLPLAKETFNLEGRGGRTAFWLRKDLLNIAAIRNAKPVPAAVGQAIYVHEGIKLRRESDVRAALGCSYNTLGKWAKRCPGLAGAAFVRFKIPSQFTTMADEWGYREDQFQLLMKIPAAERTWGLRRTEVKPWLQNAARDARGRLRRVVIVAPIAAPRLRHVVIDKSVVNIINGAHAPTGDEQQPKLPSPSSAVPALVKSPKKRGRKRMENEYVRHAQDWRTYTDDAGPLEQAEWCREKRIDQGELTRAINLLRKRQTRAAHSIARP